MLFSVSLWDFEFRLRAFGTERAVIEYPKQDNCFNLFVIVFT